MAKGSAHENSQNRGVNDHGAQMQALKHRPNTSNSSQGFSLWIDCYITYVFIYASIASPKPIYKNTQKYNLPQAQDSQGRPAGHIVHSTVHKQRTWAWPGSTVVFCSCFRSWHCTRKFGLGI